MSAVLKQIDHTAQLPCGCIQTHRPGHVHTKLCPNHAEAISQPRRDWLDIKETGT